MTFLTWSFIGNFGGVGAVRYIEKRSDAWKSLQHFRKQAGLNPMTGEAVTSEAPLLHQQTIKQLLRSMDEDAQAIADYAKDDGTYISAKAVRILVGNIQESIMHIQEKIGS